MAADDPTSDRAFVRRLGALTAVAAVPGGATVFTGGDDGAVRQWDRDLEAYSSGGVLLEHDGPVGELAVTPDGLKVLSAGADGVIRIWDVGGKQEIDPLFMGPGPVMGIAVTRGGEHVVSAGFDGSIQVRDIASGGLVGDPMTTYSGPVFAVDVSPDGTLVVAVGVAGTVSVWDIMTGRLIGESSERHEGPAFAVAVTADGARAVSAGQDGSVRLWDIDSLRQIDINPGDGVPVFDLALAPEGMLVLAARGDGAVAMWDLATDVADERCLVGHTGPVRAVAASSGLAVSVGDDGTARIWDLDSRVATGPPMTVTPTGGSYAVASTSATAPFSPQPNREPQPRYAGVVTDDESTVDHLGVTEDVHTVAALLTAVGTAPPLSVAILGNWGAGKSTFMGLVRRRVADLARSATDHPGTTGFVGNVWQVRFNAWHYSDDHLWVGLVEHLFRELRERPEDRRIGEPHEQRIALESRLAAEKARQSRLDRTLEQVDELDPDRGWLGWLAQPLRSALILRESGRSAWRQLRSAQVLLGLALIVVGAVAIVLADQFGAHVLAWVAGGVATATGLLTSAVAVWRKIQELTDTARKKLIADKQRGSEEIARLESELNRLDPARELDRLLNEITSTDRYERYRGLTGRIHHDLSRLSDELRSPAGADPSRERRIILYVDDLDRCVAGRVVEVLQAVNLLLSMPLFTVIVAVDPRWLLRALDEHHGSMLNARATGQNHSLDYLDKIFHVPYALPPMSNRGRAYIRRMLPQAEYRPPPASSTPYAPASVSPQPPWATPPPAPPQPPPPFDPDRPPPIPPPPPPLEVRTEGLRLTQAEWDFLPLMAPLIPTPRAVKKLSNLYRLVRIGIPDKDIESFVGDDSGGAYQAAALLLAAIVSAPGQAEALLAGLLEAAAEDDGDVVSVLRALVDAAPLNNALADLVTDIRAANTAVNGDLGPYRTWARHVARYSFATYHLFNGTDSD